MLILRVIYVNFSLVKRFVFNYLFLFCLFVFCFYYRCTRKVTTGIRNHINSYQNENYASFTDTHLIPNLYGFLEKKKKILKCLCLYYFIYLFTIKVNGQQTCLVTNIKILFCVPQEK